MSSDRCAVAFVLLWTCAAFLSRSYGIWATMGITAVALGAVAVACYGSSLLGGGRHLRMIVPGALAGLAMAVATTLLFDPVTAIVPPLRADVAGLYREFDRVSPVTAIWVLPLIVLGEELVWRGAVQRALSRRMAWVPAAAVSAVIYALAHAPAGSLTLILTCLGAGYCWSVFRALTDSLPAVLVAHLVWDAAVLGLHQVTSAT